VRLPTDISSLTPALVFIEPRYNNRIVFEPVIRELVLNRPDAAPLPPNLPTVDLRFGADITLLSYEIAQGSDQLDITLYWQANAVPVEDYQVFVHLLNSRGQMVSQRDTAPVEGRYPTSQWRSQTTIVDQHVLVFDTPLPAGDYEVRVGLYQLADGARLPITPVSAQTMGDSAQIYVFSMGN